MRDTPPEIEQRVRAMIREKTPLERLKMGGGMYATSKYLVTRAILERSPNISPNELRRELFLAFYRNDFSPAEREKIVRHLEKPA